MEEDVRIAERICLILIIVAVAACQEAPKKKCTPLYDKWTMKKTCAEDDSFDP